MIRIDIPTQNRDALGECPIWDAAAQALYWIDSKQKLVRRHTPSTGASAQWQLPQEIGSIAFCESGRLLVALEEKFVFLDLESGAWSPVASVRHPAERMRLNDGRTDRGGRFIVGSLVMGRLDRDGVLYRLNADATVEQLDAGFAVSNGTCFSPAGDYMYFADSRARQIFRYRYDTASGAIGKRELFIDTNVVKSGPDGATVDADGCLWVALVEAGQVACYSPQGALLRLIDMPVPYVTCPCFGGPNLDILYVTSISNSGNALRSDHPDSGALFAVHGTGSRGLAEARFADRGIPTQQRKPS